AAGFLEHLEAGLALFGFLFVFAALVPAGLGMGDAKLGLLLGLALGSRTLPAMLATFAASFIAAVWVLGRHGLSARKQTIPFGPYMALGAKFQRVQFTPDPTATDLIGTVTVRAGEVFLERGALFTNVLLADEINRTPPRVQAALLEAMQERHVSVKGRTFFIDPPFFVMATQNPYEHDGVYSITESQLDRFIFKLDLEYGSEA